MQKIRSSQQPFIEKVGDAAEDQQAEKRAILEGLNVPLFSALIERARQT